MCEKHACTTALILSVLVGIGLAVVYSLGFIVQTAIVLFVAFGLAVATLFTVIFILTTQTDERGSPVARCLCPYGGCIVGGAIGTIVSAVAGLAITLTVTGIISIIIFFLVGAFLTLMLISLLQFVCCALREYCCK